MVDAALGAVLVLIVERYRPARGRRLDGEVVPLGIGDVNRITLGQPDPDRGRVGVDLLHLVLAEAGLLWVGQRELPDRSPVL